MKFFFPAGLSIIILADQAIGVHHLPMKLNLVSKLIPALFIAAGLCIGCGEAGDTGSTQSVAPAEEGLPADAEMVFLKVEGMT